MQEDISTPGGHEVIRTRGRERMRPSRNSMVVVVGRREAFLLLPRSLKTLACYLIEFIEYPIAMSG